MGGIARWSGGFLGVGALVAAGAFVWPQAQPPAPAAEPAAAAPAVREKKPVRLVAVGDLMLGTNVKTSIARHGPNHPFRKYRAVLQGADVTFGNLETPISDRGAPTPGKSAASLRNRTNYIFRTPPAVAEGLAWAGFDVLSVANNHTMDYGRTALEDTLTAVREQGMEAVGAGTDLDSARAPVFVERNGQRLAFFAISDILPLFSAASARSAGVAPARGSGFERWLPAAIAEAKKEADWVLVSVHWGKERFTGATARQRSLGHQLVHWGADVVIGHHTHCLGPIERYGDGLIHYSLGNFISHLGSRRSLEAWEVTLRPGSRPAGKTLAFRWDGERIASTR